MAAYWEEVLADSPTLLMKLDETSGTLTDSSTSGLSGTSSGSVTYHTTGPDATGIPYAFGFTGANSYISIANNTALDLGNGPFSVEFWMKRISASGTANIFGKGDGSFPSSGIAGEVGSAPDYVYFEQGGSNKHISTSGTVDDTNWHHIVFTRAAATNAIAYLDGTAGTTLTLAKTFSNNTLALVLGDLYAASTYGWFDSGSGGYMAGFALYKSELSSGRVAAHYAARSTGSAVPSATTGMLGFFG